MFNHIYHKKRVLVTGHTGFKGSWLTFWLERLGAELCGVALPMTDSPTHFELLRPGFRSEMCDLRDAAGLCRIFADFQPEIVFHLAAQPLVRRSYREPLETFAVNVMGTLHLLEACRQTPAVRAVVVVTSDKCYENREQSAGYRETDPMGGYDPYSASKGCAELATACFRRSFFHSSEFGRTHRTLVATARAGNVIGGGDWAEDRLAPDLMRNAAVGAETEIRSPYATRPWQHVLEPLSGYLALGQRLAEGDARFADGWNFGPSAGSAVTVQAAAAALAAAWPAIRVRINPPPDAPHEAGLLQLDCGKAQRELEWHGVWDAAETFRRTAHWYRDFYRDGTVDTESDLENYLETARRENLTWTK